MKKYFEILKRFIKLEIMTDMQYRLNFILSFLSTTSWLFAELLFLNFLLQNYGTIADWSLYEIGLLVATNQIWVGGAFFLVIWPSLSTFAGLIRTGGADKIFTLPINTRFYISTFKSNWTSLTILINGIILLIYCILKLQLQIEISDAILYFIFILLSSYIIYCIQFIATCTIFWLIEANSILYITNTIDRLSRFPYEVYLKGALYIFFTFVLPIALISNVPVRLLLDILEIRYVFYLLIVTLILFFLTKVIWKAGVNRYESASS